MQETLNYILNNYSIAKKGTMKNNKIANYIRTNAPKKISEDAKINTEKYAITGSPGIGQWSDVPWIAIFDNDITHTATKGYYIVYLFCADMSGVYISLNQGWTYFKNKYGRSDGKEKIRLVTNAWKNILSSTLTDFSFKQIHLNGISKNSDLAEGYELGHICGKFYKKDKIPNDIELVEDLRNLLGVYRELKGKLKNGSIEKTNNYLIVNHNLGLLYDEPKENIEDGSINNIEDMIEDSKEKSQLIKESSPSSFLNKVDVYNNDFKSKKQNFIKIIKNQKRLGFAGELMVLNYEKERLIDNDKFNLVKKLKHVSEDEGDGAGYDILSFETNGTKKYIEVKTTTGNASTPFIITANELNFSKINASNYYLYRVFDFNKKNFNGKFFIIRGDLSKKIKIKPQQYIVTGIINE